MFTTVFLFPPYSLQAPYVGDVTFLRTALEIYSFHFETLANQLNVNLGELLYKSTQTNS